MLVTFEIYNKLHCLSQNKIHETYESEYSVTKNKIILTIIHVKLFVG